MMRVYIFFFLFMLFSKEVLSNVHWKVLTVPAVFGENMILSCESDTNCENCPHQWRREQDLIAFENTTFEKSKFEIHWGFRSYNLKIINFSQEDVNVKYTCSIGFFVFGDILSITEEGFIYLPPPLMPDLITFDDMNIAHINITLDPVFPTPKCSAFLGNEDISDGIAVTTKPTGIFYSSNIQLNVSVSCGDNIGILCKVGHLRRTVLQHVNSTKDCSVEAGMIISTIIGTTVIITGLFLICWYLKRNKHKSYHSTLKGRDKNTEINRSQSQDRIGNGTTNSNTLL